MPPSLKVRVPLCIPPYHYLPFLFQAHGEDCSTRSYALRRSWKIPTSCGRKIIISIPVGLEKIIYRERLRSSTPFKKFHCSPQVMLSTRDTAWKCWSTLPGSSILPTKFIWSKTGNTGLRIKKPASGQEWSESSLGKKRIWVSFWFKDTCARWFLTTKNRAHAGHS